MLGRLGDFCGGEFEHVGGFVKSFLWAVVGPETLPGHPHVGTGLAEWVNLGVQFPPLELFRGQFFIKVLWAGEVQGETELIGETGVVVGGKFGNLFFSSSGSGFFIPFNTIASSAMAARVSMAKLSHMAGMSSFWKS